MVGKGCSCGTLNYIQKETFAYTCTKLFLKKGTYHTHALFSGLIFLFFLMPTMINLVVFNHSPKFESDYSKYMKDTRFRIKIRIKRNHYLSLDSVQMIN